MLNRIKRELEQGIDNHLKISNNDAEEPQPQPEQEKQVHQHE